MSIVDLRNQSYDPIEWEDRVIDQATGDVLVEGTPVNEVNLNRLESGLMLSHFDIGMALLAIMQQTLGNKLEIEKLYKQRLLQGEATITAAATNGYYRDTEPFVQVNLTGFSQINYPNYDVLLTIKTASDMDRVGRLEAYDKLQNGFKVKMTGSASSVTFIWTLINPRV